LDRDPPKRRAPSFVMRLWDFAQVATGIVVIASLGMVMGNGVLKQKYMLDEEKRRLDKENEKLQVEIRMLERDLTRLRNNPRAIEKAAKSKLGMARHDETIYLFGEGLSSSAGRRANEIAASGSNRKR